MGKTTNNWNNSHLQHIPSKRFYRVLFSQVAKCFTFFPLCDLALIFVISNKHHSYNQQNHLTRKWNSFSHFPISEDESLTNKKINKIKAFSLRSFSTAIESRKIELNCVRMNEKLFKSFKMDLDYGRCDERLERI